MSYEAEVSDLIKRLYSLQGSINQMKERAKEIEQQVAQSKRFIDIQPDVATVLTELQHKAHERSVGVYEKLLTAILHDVLGETSRKVSMDLEIKRGVPSLEINIDHNGEKESIMDGQGGSVANVVSAGLRFVVLSRLSDNRQFIVMDEPDCWLSPEKVPAFFNVVSKLSKDAGIQVLVISHHDTSLFGEVGITELVNSDGNGSIQTEVIKQGSEWDEDDEGIRSIRLINFMSHEFTHIDLDPHVTVVCGENNLGKSAIVSALRGVFFNEGKDHMVRHGEKEAVVEITAEEGIMVRWTRKCKGSNRTKYELINSEFHLLHEEYNGNEVPAWADVIMRVRKEHDIDVHIGRQKLPLFMIGEKASKCAEILSIGRESRYLHAMLAENKTQTLQHKRSAKNGESEYAKIQGLLESEEIRSVDDLLAQAERLRKTASQLDKEPQELRELDKVIRELHSLEEKYRSYEETNIDESLISSPPEFYAGNEKLQKFIESIESERYLIEAQNILNRIVVPETPSILETATLLEYGRKLFEMEKVLSDISRPLEEASRLPERPEYAETEMILVHGRKLKSSYDFISKTEAQIREDEDALEKIIEELDSFDACPLCGSDISLDKQHKHEENSSRPPQNR